MLFASFKEDISIGASASVNQSTIFYPGTTFSVGIMAEQEITSVTENQIGGISNYISYNPVGDSTGVGIYLLDNEIQIPASNAQNIGNVNAFYSAANHYGSGPALSVNGVYGAAYNQGPGLVSAAFGVYGDVAVSNTGNVTVGYSLYARALNEGGGGNFLTAYGLYIDNIQANNSYGVYQSNAGNKNFFAGPIQEGGSKRAPIRTLATSDAASATSDQKFILNDGNALNTNTVTLPAGEEGLTYKFGVDSANLATWNLATTGGDTVDTNVPANIATAVTGLEITFTAGKWYAT